MLIFKWDKSLETGIPLLDNQHEQIFEHSNTFFIHIKCGRTGQSVRDCLDFLEQYVLFHFQTEEAFQVDTHYPLYRDHQAKHAAIATQVKFFYVRLQSTNYDATVVEEFRVFLSEWITNHILNEDRAFSIYYRAYGKEKAKDATQGYV